MEAATNVTSAANGQKGQKAGSASPFALLGAANASATKIEGETGLGFGFQRFLGKLQALTLQAQMQSLVATQQAVADESQLLLTEAQLTALNPSAFNNSTLAQYFVDPALAGELKGFLQKLQQIIIKLNLQPTNADGSLAQLDLSKVDLSKLSLDEFQLFKKLAMADIAAFVAKPKTQILNGKIVVEKPQGPNFLDDTTATNALLSSPHVVQVLQVLHRLQVKMPDPAAPAGTAPVLVLDTKGLNQTEADALAAFAAQAAAMMPAGTLPLAETSMPSMLNAALNSATTETAVPLSTAVPSASGVTNNMFDSTGVEASNGVIGLTFAQKAIAASLAGSNTKGGVHAGGLKLNPAAASVAAVDGGAFHMADASEAAALQDFLNSGISFNAPQTNAAGTQAVNQNAAHGSSTQSAVNQVQVAIQKLIDRANGKTDSTMLIHLDPVELGRVRVKLSFGENGTIKARVLVERPETLSLLQKEASVLERGLQDAGFALSPEGGMSFDLSQQHGFAGFMGEGQTHKNNQGHGGAGTESDDAFAADEAMTIGEIETIDVAVDDGRVNVKV